MIRPSSWNRVIIIACLLPATASSAKSTYLPFDWNTVGFSDQCEPNSALSRVLTILSGPKAPIADDAVPDFDEPLYNAVSGDTLQELKLDDPVSWNGLKLRKVTVDAGIERGPVNYSLTFDDSPATVRMVWNRLGWKLPASGARPIVGLENYASIGIVPSGGDSVSTSVTCFRD